MTVHVELEVGEPTDVPTRGVLGTLQAALDQVNNVVMALSAIALGAAGLVLTWEVAGRYFFAIPSEWQDELSVFLLVGASFGAASWIQTRRGHIGIHALASVLSPRADAARRLLADIATLAFCAFFCWKCWTLLHEAWDEGQISGSAWGPPLWIPYSIMAVGMTLLVLQLVLQALTSLAGRSAR